MEDQDWVRPEGRVESEAVLKSKTTLEPKKAKSKATEADGGRSRAAGGVEGLIMREISGSRCRKAELGN